MAILVTCSCGRGLSLKNDLAGELIRCPDCGNTIEVPAVAAQADPVFDRDRFLLRQRVLSIAQVYDVRGDDNASLLVVRRPSHVLWMILGILAGLVVFPLVFGGFLAAAFAVLAALDVAPERANEIAGFAGLAGAVLGMFATVATVVAIVPRRHVYFHRDPKSPETILEIHQDSKLMPFRPRFTLVCPHEGPIAKFSKNVFLSFFRKRWWCHGIDGTPICTAYEDSIILSLLRRLLGPMLGLLRTNYVIVQGTDANGERIGEFNRKLTLFDRYVLDLTADPMRSLDRRVALALGVMLDTGDGR